MTDSDLEHAKHFDPLMAPHYERLTRDFLASLGWTPEIDHEFSVMGFQLRQKDSDSIIRIVFHDTDVLGGWHATFANATVKIDFQTGPDAINLWQPLIDALKEL